ncbi:MAG: hypothetical protein QM490_02210 [Candidatus Gracilibacteria bacterium]
MNPLIGDTDQNKKNDGINEQVIVEPTNEWDKLISSLEELRVESGKKINEIIK